MQLPWHNTFKHKADTRYGILPRHRKVKRDEKGFDKFRGKTAWSITKQLQNEMMGRGGK